MPDGTIPVRGGWDAAKEEFAERMIDTVEARAPGFRSTIVGHAIRTPQDMADELRHVLLRQGRFIDAERVATATAEQVQRSGQVSTAQLSVYGGLLLRGATAAARQGRAGAATDLLGEAVAVAQRTGMDRTDYMTSSSGRAMS